MSVRCIDSNQPSLIQGLLRTGEVWISWQSRRPKHKGHSPRLDCLPLDVPTPLSPLHISCYLGVRLSRGYSKIISIRFSVQTKAKGCYNVFGILTFTHDAFDLLLHCLFTVIMISLFYNNKASFVMLLYAFPQPVFTAGGKWNTK